MEEKEYENGFVESGRLAPPDYEEQRVYTLCSSCGEPLLTGSSDEIMAELLRRTNLTLSVRQAHPPLWGVGPSRPAYGGR